MPRFQLQAWVEGEAQQLIEDSDSFLELIDCAKRRCYWKRQPLPLPRTHRQGENIEVSTQLATQVPSAQAKANILVRQADALAGELSCRRHYIMEVQDGAAAAAAGGPQWQLDPRFLVFEYLLTFVLREAQVQLVREFVEARQQGRSRVQQMIMVGFCE